MGSLDDNALKTELEQMQQRLLTALGSDTQRDQRLKGFLSHWNNVKERLVTGIKQNTVSDETKQLAAQVARTVAVVAQGFLNLEKASASILSATSLQPAEIVQHREPTTAQDCFRKPLEEKVDTGLESLNRLKRDPAAGPLQKASLDSVDAKGSNFCPQIASASPIKCFQHLNDESLSSDDDDFESEDGSSDYEDDIEPKWDVLRDWVLAHISAPFPPCGQEELDLLKASQIDSDGLSYWLKSIRDTSGWTSLLETYAGGDLTLMKNLCEDILEEFDESVQGHPEVMRSSFIAMREHIKTLDIDGPSDWWGDVEELFATMLSMSGCEEGFDYSDSESIWDSDVDPLEYTDDWEVEDLPSPRPYLEPSTTKPVSRSFNDPAPFRCLAGCKRRRYESGFEDLSSIAEESPSKTKRRRIAENPIHPPAWSSLSPTTNDWSLETPCPALTPTSEISAASCTPIPKTPESALESATSPPLFAPVRTAIVTIGSSSSNIGRRKRKITDLEPQETLARPSTSVPSLPIDISNEPTDRETNYTTPSDLAICNTSVSPSVTAVKTSREQVQIASIDPPSKKRRGNNQIEASSPSMVQPNSYSQSHALQSSARQSRVRPSTSSQDSGSRRPGSNSKLLLPGWSRIINSVTTESTSSFGKDAQSSVDACTVTPRNTEPMEKHITTSLLYSQPPTMISKSITQLHEHDDPPRPPTNEWTFFDEPLGVSLASSSYICPHPLRTIPAHQSPASSLTPQTPFADDATEVSSIAGTSLHTPSPLPFYAADTDAYTNDGSKPVMLRSQDYHRDLGSGQYELEKLLVGIIGHSDPVGSLPIEGQEESNSWWGR
ncbi:hypothetical protein FRC14_003332 [Serendipita sp. 396]|nr:hypothetical protein FRC14_003332 [Serendipita sp. 396]KAG8776802.1 hypothetical protein FRC15_011744 [Serendipita sp. 397]KAG8799452.1 hypothetical protein FRC16_005077 [Serendipita sp. 398]KAG8858149.1 hypothetical protein FRC20_012056 [Serendipita sp. 405]